MQPIFHHPEIKNLYQYDLELPADIIESILQLPRKTVIEDLEAVVRDAIIRYDEFKEKDWFEYTSWFPSHAMLLLGGLRAEESLPLLLEVHQQGGTWVEHWFGDWFYENHWEPLVWCGMNRLDDLSEFVKNNNSADEFISCNVVMAMTQIALHFPEKRTEVVAKIEHLLHFYLDATYTEASQEAVINNVTALTNAVCDLKEDTLLPLVEECYKKELVDLMMCGDWKKFVKFYKQYELAPRRISANVVDWYAYEWQAQKERDAQSSKWREEKRKKDEEQAKKEKLTGKFTPVHDTLFNPSKVGRNDPCPCGSGKKYKKCCG